MKIGCIGNMNNNMFCLVRYLRQAGFDAHLVLLAHEEKHFLPQADSYGDGWKEYTTHVTWGGGPSFVKTPPERVRADLESFDFFIGSNLAPAFLHKAGLHLHVFTPHGSDYYEVPHRTLTDGTPDPLAVAQKAALQGCDYYFAPGTNARREEYWQALDMSGERIMLPSPLIYVGEYANDNARFTAYDSPHLRMMEAVRADCEILVFHHVRHCWVSPAKINSHKGNDVLFRGFKEFIRKSGRRARLAAFEYGPDVEASKRLVGELGLEDSVVWLPKMTRKELMPLMRLSDVVAIEFAHSWLSGGALYEGLAMEKPILARLDETMREGGYPALAADSPEEVCRRLEECLADPVRMARIGREGREWLERERNQPAVDRMVQILESCGKPAAERTADKGMEGAKKATIGREEPFASC